VKGQNRGQFLEIDELVELFEQSTPQQRDLILNLARTIHGQQSSRS
jgi:hypothetical protein